MTHLPLVVLAVFLLVVVAEVVLPQVAAVGARKVVVEVGHCPLGEWVVHF